MKRKLTLLLALVMLAMVLLPACGSSAAPSSAPAAETAQQPGSAQPAEAAAPQSTSGAVSGRTDLNLALNAAVETLNPYITGAIATKQVLFQMNDSLLFVDDVGEMEPRIATAVETSADGLAYTFTLRDDVYFHNGDKLTADDVAWSIHYALNPDDGRTYSATVKNYASAEAVDANTVVIKTLEPTATFLKGVSMIPILCQKEVEAAGEDFGVKPIPAGCGPYMLDKYEPDYEVVFKAFDQYYRGKAPIETVTYKILTDNSTTLAAFEAGEIDFVTVPTADWLRISTDDRFTSYLNPSSHISYIMINIRGIEPYNDVRVRQALNYAIDKEAVILGAYEGLGEVADTWFNPATVFGGTTEGITIYDYNPEKAKELLAEAGYPDGFDAGTILCSASSYWPKMAEVIQDQLADVGIKCTVESMESNSARTRRQDGAYTLATTGLSIEGEPSYAELIWKKAGESGKAEMDMDDPEITAAFAKANSKIDPEERKDAYKELIELMQEKAYTVPVFHKSTPFAWDPQLNAKLYMNYYYVYDFSWQ